MSHMPVDNPLTSQVRYNYSSDNGVPPYVSSVDGSGRFSAVGSSPFSHRSPRIQAVHTSAYGNDASLTNTLPNRSRAHPSVPVLNLQQATHGGTDGCLSERRLSHSTLARTFTPLSSRSATAHSIVQYDTRPDQSAATPTWESGAITPKQALTRYSSFLTQYEQSEILDYPSIYFVGRQNAPKIEGSFHMPKMNYGYDDERGDYRSVQHDHIAYRYEVLGLLGKGSFGQVLRVHDFRTSSDKALKIIRNKRRFHTQALVEVTVLQHLRDHDPNDTHHVIHMHEHFYFRGHLCITFELLSINLYDFIKQHNFQGLRPPVIRRFAQQILVALKYMKSQQIIHCDLKPENILLKSSNRSTIKVIDFGSSCFFDKKMYTYIQSRFYRSPEVILGTAYGPEIDMWSFGCILAELFTGCPLFPGEGEQEQLWCIMEVFGHPPMEMLERATRTKLFFDSQLRPRIQPNKKGVVRQPKSKTIAQVLNCSDPLFLDLLERCFDWEPAKRITPEQALLHPWIADQMLSPSHRQITPRYFSEQGGGHVISSSTPRRGVPQLDATAMQQQAAVATSLQWPRGQSQLSSQSAAALQAHLLLQQQAQQHQQQVSRSHSQQLGSSYNGVALPLSFEQLAQQAHATESPVGEESAYTRFGRNSSTFSTARNLPASAHSTPRSYGTLVDLTGTAHLMLQRNLSNAGPVVRHQAGEGTPRSGEAYLSSSHFQSALDMSSNLSGAARQSDYGSTPQRTLPHLGRTYGGA